MKYNEKYKCWVSKEGVLFKLRGTTNQFGYHGDYGLRVIAAHPWTSGGKYLYHKSEGIHRIVWITFNGEIPEGYEIDHINRDVTDNRLENLRLVSHKENCANRNNIKSEETKKKIGEAMKGKKKKPFSEEHRKHLSEAKMGKKRGPYIKRG